MPARSRVHKPEAGFKFLGKVTPPAADTLDRIPWEGGHVTVTLDCTEFTSLCPITGQPDFARLSIEYVPDRWLIETKSMKLFLQKYRDTKAFNEVVVDMLADEFFRQAEPVSVVVKGSFNLRGGIGVTAVARRER